MTDYIKQVIKKYIKVLTFTKEKLQVTMNMILIFLPQFIFVGPMVSKSTLR